VAWLCCLNVAKTLVYKIAGEIMRASGHPQSTLSKPPSAELADQKDQDSLPPYDVLDAILEAHVERGLDSEALRALASIPRGADVMRLMRQSDTKRRQLPPGLRSRAKAFWHRPPATPIARRFGVRG